MWLLDLKDDRPFDDQGWLSTTENVRLRSYGSPLLQRQFLRRRHLARLVLGEALRLAPQHVPLEQGDKGQPIIKGWQVSFSHSGNFGLVALHRKIVGVDLERLEPFDFAPVLRDHFTLDEGKAVLASQDPLQAFYEGWTRKESAAKAEAHGLSVDLKRYSAQGDALPWCSLVFKPAPGYVSAVTWKD
jgi:4'-phosphopantetheinyl transferase